MVKDHHYYSILFVGLAVYFFVDPLPNETLSKEENDSNNGQKVCSASPPESLVPLSYEGPTQQHWLLRKAFSIIKYLLFGAFVLACNKLHRYLKVHRLRTNSTSSNDAIDVSA